MTQGKTLIIVLVTLLIGFGAGFVVRPVIVPISQPAALGPVPAAPSAEARGRQYFAAHLDEARQVAMRCAAGTARGDECGNAEQAVIEADGQERFKRFMGN